MAQPEEPEEALFQWSIKCVGDRTGRGGKDKAGEVSGVTSQRVL